MKLREFVKTGFAEDDSAVSPVIGVILMVAITVILAAVIATFVLGLGEQVNSTPQAAVTFDQKGGNSVELTLTSSGNLDLNKPITINTDCSGSTGSLSSVGDTMTVSGCTDGNTITVTASTKSGSKGVIAQYTYDG